MDNQWIMYNIIEFNFSMYTFSSTTKCIKYHQLKIDKYYAQYHRIYIYTFYIKPFNLLN